MTTDFITFFANAVDNDDHSTSRWVVVHRYLVKILYDSHKQDSNAGNSRAAVSSAEVSWCQMRFSTLPVIGAARRWLRLTGIVWLPICVLQ